MSDDKMDTADMTLPPHVPETDFGNIPAPVGWIVGPCGQFHPNPASEVNGPGSVAWSIPCYTESSMRAYATAAVLAEREACAKACDDESLFITASMIRERSAV